MILEKYPDFGKRKQLQCTCSDFVSAGGHGKCQKPCSNTKGLHCCYVNQPSSCKDLVNSGVHSENQVSAEACTNSKPENLQNIY